MKGPTHQGLTRAVFVHIEGENGERGGHGGLTTRLRDLMDDAKKVLSKDGAVKASERKELLHRLEMVEQEIRANLPFMLKQFERATEKVATAAKAEVDAFITHAAMKLGIERLRELAVGLGPVVPELAEGSECPECYGRGAHKLSCSLSGREAPMKVATELLPEKGDGG